VSDVQEKVRSHYAALALKLDQGAGCCGAESCGESPDYSRSELAELGLPPSLSLGCGNPTLLAQLEPGEVVLDLGSGGGLDVLLSARRVGPGGHAYGLDLTDEMLELAGRNLERSGLQNVTFLKGSIERIPLANSTVDVVISNCVINLAEDKRAVLGETFRVLKPGGRLAVADLVALTPLSEALTASRDDWVGCLAGTIHIEEYRRLVAEVGFQGANIELSSSDSPSHRPGEIVSSYIRATKPGAL